MKLYEIINNLDKSNRNRDDNITWDLEEFIAALGLSCYGIQQDPSNHRLKSYWIANHICTDTWVGFRAYFLDDSFVCVSYQSGRKCNEDITWLNAEVQVQVRNYLISLAQEDDFCADTKFLDMNEDWGEGYPIQYTGQCLKKDVLYKGAMVKILRDGNEGYDNMHTITIQEQTTLFEKEIPVRDILVPWYTTGE